VADVDRIPSFRPLAHVSTAPVFERIVCVSGRRRQLPFFFPMEFFFPDFWVKFAGTRPAPFSSPLNCLLGTYDVRNSEPFRRLPWRNPFPIPMLVFTCKLFSVPANCRGWANFTLWCYPPWYLSTHRYSLSHETLLFEDMGPNLSTTELPLCVAGSAWRPRNFFLPTATINTLHWLQHQNLSFSLQEFPPP